MVESSQKCLAQVESGAEESQKSLKCGASKGVRGGFALLLLIHLEVWSPAKLFRELLSVRMGILAKVELGLVKAETRNELTKYTRIQSAPLQSRTISNTFY